jgi:hypothetical protein
MRASRHEADVGACACKLQSQISTDRAGAVDADFHGMLQPEFEIYAEITGRL